MWRKLEVKSVCFDWISLIAIIQRVDNFFSFFKISFYFSVIKFRVYF